LRYYSAFALPLVPIGLFETVTALSDRYVIGFFKGAEFVGIYSATYNIGVMAVISLYSISYILSPTIFKLFDEKKFSKVKTYLSYSLKYFCLFSIPCVFGLTVLAEPLLNALTTSEFISRDSMPIILLVSSSMIFYGIYTIFGKILMLFRQTKIFVVAFGIAAVTNLGLNIILVPRFGILAAAITTLIAYAIAATIVYYKSCQYMKFEINWNFIIKALLSSMIMILVIYLFEPTGIIKILLSIGIGAIIYFGMLYLLKGFEKKELKIISEVLKLDKIYERL
jgi:O-antigen/teichoic acid export membrane protein